MNYLQLIYLIRNEHVAKRDEDASERGRKLFSEGELCYFKVLSGDIRAIDTGKAKRNKKWLVV